MAPANRMWREAGTLRGVIHGALPSKANSRQLFYVNAKKQVCPCSCHVRMRANGLADLASRAWCCDCTKAHQKRAIITKSEEAIAWVEACVQTCVLAGVHTLLLEGRFGLDAVVYQDSLRRDLDVELLPDGIEDGHVLKNDRSIWTKHYWRRIDREVPRVEFRLRALPESDVVPVQEELFREAAEERVPF